jgi:hypothetical protein
LELFIDLLSKGGLPVALTLFVWGLKERWWVMGQEYEEMRDERDYERTIRRIVTDVADDATKEVVKRGTPANRTRRDPNA